MQPLVSIVIPTYGRPDRLVEAVKSVVTQSYTNWELIIVDDNPPRSENRQMTREAVAGIKLPNEINYIEQPANFGACKARNVGVEAAKGLYIAFLDDDDVWFADKLEKQVAVLESEKADLNYCDMYLSYNNRKKYYYHRLLNRPFEILLNRGFGVCTSAILIKSQVAIDIGGFDETLPSMQDYDFLLRVSKKYRLSEVPEALFVYKLGDDGITQNVEKKLLGHKKILSKYISDYRSLGLNAGLSRQYESIADFYSRLGCKGDALKHYLQAIREKVSFRVLVKFIGCLFTGGWFLDKYLKIRLKRSLRDE